MEVRLAARGRKLLLAAFAALLATVGSGCGVVGPPNSDPEPSAVSPMSISSVLPASGALAGGTAITLRGASFPSGAAVTVGGKLAADVVVQSGDRITCLTPAGSAAGPADVQVSAAGVDTATLQRGFTYKALPVISTPPSPASGPLTGGTRVQLSGSGFEGEVSVSVGGRPATGIVISGTGSLTFLTPIADAAGPAPIEANSSECGSVTLDSGFRYNAAPTITGPPSPGAGPLAGSTAITMTGTNFLGDVEVTIGGVRASSVAVDSSRTRITCSTPASGVAGAAPVVVTCADAGSVKLAAGFTYSPAPSAAAITPNSGPLAGGTLVTISGTGFTSLTSVTVGGAAAGNISVTSATQLTCSLPPRTTPGAVEVTVTTAGGTTSIANGYTYNAPPGITLPLAPGNGPLSGGTAIEITGTNFLGSVSVAIGGRLATNAVVIGGTVITCTVPPAATAGTVDVVVSCTGSGSSTAAGAFRYEPAPAISSVAPAAGGPLSGGTPLVITGSSFVGAVSVMLGGVPASGVAVTGGTRITCVSPGVAAAGTVPVVVTCSSSGTATLLAGFTYNAPPIVTAPPSPSTGPQAGGTTALVGGTGFLGNVTVTVGGVAATGVVVTGGTQLSFVTPPSNAAGSAAVVIDCSASGSVTLAGGFGYNAPPSVSLPLQPGTGPVGGGTTLTIAGGSFLGTVNVTVGTTLATGVVVTGPTQLTCSTPAAGAAGPVPIVVSCSASGSITVPDAFTYNPTPTISTIGPGSGSQDGFSALVIRGANFLGSVSVTVGGLPATNVALTGTTQIDCLTPPGAGAGAVPVQVTCSGSGTVTAAGGYTYNPLPTLNAPVTPGSGLTTGGTALVITGANFLGGVTVTVGGAPASSVVVTGGTRINCVAPPSGVAGPVPVTVTSTTHGSVTQSAGFTYIPSVALVSPVTPNNGTAQGGTPIRITGANFFGTVTVAFGGFTATSVVVSGGGTIIDCITPAVAASLQTVTVSSSTNGSASLPSAYTFNPPPTITLITPSGGPQSGAAVTIGGTSFLNTVSVTIGAQPATSVTVTGGTTITCVAPPAASPGAVDVTVSSSSNGVVVSAPGFTYNPAVSFNVSNTAAAGTTPEAVVAGDVNRDGLPDLVIANSGSADVTVLLGVGSGLYSAAPGSPIVVGAAPTGVALLDVDRNGALDMLVANSVSGTLTVLRNTGGGSFTPFAGSPVAVGNAPRQVAGGDFDRDGKLDVAVCNRSDGTVSVLLGDGAGAFSAAPGSPVTVGTGPRALACADIDRDGALDIAVVNETSGSISVLRGDGTGRFNAAAGSPISVGALPVSLAIADLDRDGDLDLAVASQTGSEVAVLRGSGTGTFVAAAGSPIVLSATPQHVEVRDLDGDDVRDLVISTPAAVQVLTGKGAAAYFPPVTIPGAAGQGALAVSDANRDGRPDIAVLSAGSPGTVNVILNGTAWIGATLLGAPRASNNVGSFGGMTTGDMNRDGIPDIIGSNVNGSGGGLNVSLGTTAGNFPSIFAIVASGSCGPPAVLDLNRDGILDAVIPQISATTLGVFLGDGTGNLPTNRSLVLGSFPRVVGVGDFNRDGREDVLVMESSNLVLFRGDGTGVLTLQTTVSSGLSNNQTMVVGDVNRDGALDALVLDTIFNRIAVLLGNGAGGFAQAPGSPMVTSIAPFRGVIDDLNRDGIPDLAVTSNSGSGFVIFIGSGTGAFTLRGTVPAGTGPRGITSLDANRDGIPDLTCINAGSDTVSVVLGNGLGDFPTRLSFSSRPLFDMDQTSISAVDVNRDGLSDVVIGDQQSSGLVVLIGR